ncbi:MAG: hypothetical protein LBI72_05965 [Flavobacteriaceae bacterium]|jgi:hypothetical protein|nr:hypothetical protein [Flavobacteriaceae bacterium]
MSKFYIFLLCIVLYSCNKKNEKEHSNRNNIGVKNLNDSLYEDFDLLTFKPKGKLLTNLEDNKVYLSFIKTIENLKIRMIINGKSKDLTIKRNKKGFYCYLQSSNEDYIKEFLYTVFLEDKIFVFILNKMGDDGKLALTSYRVLFPLDEKRMEQRELIYKLENAVYVNDFDSIEVNNYLHYNNDFESEYVYRFDYKEQFCYVYYISRNNKKELESKFKIFNSKSVASPYYYYWIML